MNLQEVFSLLEENKDERGIRNWNKLKLNDWNSFGIGLTKLKKLSKQIGRNNILADELWKSNNYDAKILSALIDIPKNVTRKQIENQIQEMDFWMLSHIFCEQSLL